MEAPAMVIAPTDGGMDTKENKASQTTAEQDLKTAGQRKINDIWEITQASIASLIVLTTCLGIIIGRLVFREVGPGSVFPPEWWTILGLVIGFYFGRTNHARLGDPVK